MSTTMFVSNHSLVGSAATRSWETLVRALTSLSVLLRFILSDRLRCGPGSVHGLPSHDRPLGHGRGGRCLSPPSITPLKPLYNPLTRQGLRQQRQKLRTNWLCSWRTMVWTNGGQRLDFGGQKKIYHLPLARARAVARSHRPGSLSGRAARDGTVASSQYYDIHIVLLQG